MAGSRLHKLGSIYERLTGLIESGAFKEVDKPIWYDVYKQHPPMYEPRFDRKPPDVEVKPIFYEEDFIRAKIHKVTKIRYFDLNSKRQISQTQGLIKACQKIMETKGVSVDEAIKLMDVTGEHAKNKKIADSESNASLDLTEMIK